MTAAIFGLVGVLVGGVIAALGQYVLGVRNEYAAATVAARLIGAELNVLCAVVESGGLDDGGVLETPVWNQQQAALALVVPSGHWNAVESAYADLATVRASRRQEFVRQDAPSQFLKTAQNARALLKDATSTKGPLHRRGSVLERRMAHWHEP
jgi:hypothetical protein